MNYLLDTHSFLWSAFSSRKLSRKASEAIVDPGNDICISTISFWEVSLKYALKKIELDVITPEELPDIAEQMGYSVLPLNSTEAASFHRLPLGVHKDPFDRMLIRQAVTQHRTLISKDTDIGDYVQYGLNVLW